MWKKQQLESSTYLKEHSSLQHHIEHYTLSIQLFLNQINQIILDKPVQTKLSLVCLLANGHVLFEDLPGLGKTTLASALAKLAGLHFNRIQFTNDMLASDVIGMNMFNQKESNFEFKHGPIFTQILLADEINRCSPKTQSALLQAMEEGVVTLDSVTYKLPEPFWVIATQNPIFQSGTYALPESQLDRFLMRLSLGYPSRAAEKSLLLDASRQTLLEQITPVLSHGDIVVMQQCVQQVYLSDVVLNYILDLASYSRLQSHGLSTRALLAIKMAAQALAFVEGREYVITDDIQTVFPAVAAHRMKMTEQDAHLLLDQVEVND
ncbi:AAA family ATPase [Acinetobacter soli]|uniref:AAA family ATPase n=1 Tax=Acinetobacter soli TaxID=487316 RepID=UPI00124F9B3E|nr:AAA family ATPase [Acinetobacter soli]MCE6007622.1 AAA family ATPase [Acinetobacter soli]MEB4800738.1 AAA family ATPase [Acinetobacter soli]